MPLPSDWDANCSTCHFRLISRNTTHTHELGTPAFILFERRIFDILCRMKASKRVHECLRRFTSNCTTIYVVIIVREALVTCPNTNKNYLWVTEIVIIGNDISSIKFKWIKRYRPCLRRRIVKFWKFTGAKTYYKILVLVRTVVN